MRVHARRSILVLLVGWLLGLLTAVPVLDFGRAAWRQGPQLVPEPTAPPTPASTVRAVTPAPLPSARVAGRRILVDLSVWVVPPTTVPTCFSILPGALEATVRLLEDETGPPVTFWFADDDGRDPAASMRIDARPEPTRMTVPVDGGRYCYGLNNWGPLSDNPRGTPVRELGRDVAVQLTWSPPTPP